MGKKSVESNLMPIISYFFEIIIKMYFDDHYPPRGY